MSACQTTPRRLLVLGLVAGSGVPAAVAALSAVVDGGILRSRPADGAGISANVAGHSRAASPCLAGQIPWSTPTGYNCQDAVLAADEARSFLVENLPPWDKINQGTLEGGILMPTVNLSLVARERHPWAWGVPHDVWREWVLPYASVNEARSDWRDLFTPTLASLVDNATFQASTTSQVVSILNEHLWTVLRPAGSLSPVVFKSQQTPLIYDPMSTLAYGYASCTGVSILFIDALRSVGVPARLVGTPAWHGVVQEGNHNWVEIYVDGDWRFMEGAPAGGGETLTNPCDKWFCNPSHFNGSTQVFAARFGRTPANFTVYPMSWDPHNLAVPGVDRSAYYQSACSRC